MIKSKTYKSSILTTYDISVYVVGINKYNSRNHTDSVIRSWLKWIISLIHRSLMLEFNSIYLSLMWESVQLMNDYIEII